MSLHHIYTLQGSAKLKLFLGHLRLQDRTGLLLHNDLTQLQLISGTGKLILNLPATDFPWIETGWLTSLWAVITDLNFKISYPNQWIPTLPRAGDAYLMETFSNRRYSTTVMRTLNRCGLVLQVITISDISSADGLYILPTVKEGTKLNTRISKLEWPNQENPSKADWIIWRSSLETLEVRGKLSSPLRPWQAPTHQQWEYYYHASTQVVLHISPMALEPVKQYTPIFHQQARTRLQHQPWYDLCRRTSTCTDLPSDLYPATLQLDTTLVGSLFQINHSSTPLSSIVPALHEAPREKYYNEYLGLIRSPPPLESIASAMDLQALTVTCGSNWDLEQRLVIGTCTFDSHKELYTYTSPAIPGTSRSRAEYLSIMVGMYISHIASQHCDNSSTARIIITNNSKKAHKEAFTQSPVGITTATQPNHDMILEIRRLRNAIPVPVQVYHTPHQNSGVPRRHPILSIPTHVHTTFQTQSNQQSLSTLWSYTPEAHIISLTSNGTEIIEDVLPTLCRAMYVNDLKQKLLKTIHGQTKHLIQSTGKPTMGPYALFPALIELVLQNLVTNYGRQV